MKLFTPLRINGMTIRNRVIMAPVSTNLPSAQGEITPEMTSFYYARGKGGTGLIILEACCLDFPQGKSGYTQIRLDSDSYLPGLYQFVDTIHETGCKVAFQLAHCGGMLGDRELTDLEPIAPSVRRYGKNKRLARAATIEDIHRFQQKFIAAARRVKQCGADALEIHGANGYLIAEFLSPWLNKREDEYGGSVENRARFAVEIVRGIRNVVGPSFPILFRINGDELTPEGRHLSETVQLVRLLKEAGVDCVHVTAGSGAVPQIPARRGHIDSMAVAQGWKSHMAREIREKCGILTVAVGSIRDVEVAERIVETDADAVAMGRQLVCDPEWVNKARTGGHIRRCISCNMCVMHRSFYGAKIRCTLNPMAGREYRWMPPEQKPLAKPRSVAVVGGGPAGLQAAYTAAQRGCSVTLFEAKDHLGGNLLPAGRIDLKYKINWILDWFVPELDRLGVNVICRKRITAEELRASDFDTIILCTGSQPRLNKLFADNFATAKDGSICQAIDLLSGTFRIPESVRTAVVVGAGLVGMEAAYHLAQKGVAVRLIEGYRTKKTLIAGHDQINGYELLYQLGRKKVVIWDHTQPKKVQDHVIIVDREGTEETLPFDLLVLAQGQIADDALAKALQDCGKEVLEAGDCLGARTIFYAVQEAFQAAYFLS